MSRDVQAPMTPCDMFEVRVERDAGATFLLEPDGRGHTYAEIADRAAALATALRASGTGPGDMVGLYLWNDPAWVVAALASWWCGATIAACGAMVPPSEASRRFELLGPRVVVVADDGEAPPGATTLALSTEGELGSAESQPGSAGGERGSTAAPPVAPAPGAPGRAPDAKLLPSPDDTAAVFFTSGTTGEPKPVAHRHRRLVESARETATAYARTPEFRPRVAPAGTPPAISFSPFGHLAGLGRMIFRLYVGRTLLLVRKFDIAVLQDLARRYPIDTLQLTPAMVHAIAFAERDVDLGSLRYVTSGTAPLPIATREAFERRYGVPVLQAYGSTEGGVTALERYEDAVAGRRGPGSVGRVAAGSAVRIVDPDGRDVRAGGEGEILGHPDPERAARYLTAMGETPLPVDGEGWYHTGDVGRIDEHGILYITGRLKEMMIVGGFNVYPAEVEDALRKSDLVEDVVVVPIPDERLGEVPIAGIVWTDVSDPEGLAHECRSRLEPYKVPRRWFDLGELPLTANGKLDRRRAAEIGAAATASGER